MHLKVWLYNFLSGRALQHMIIYRHSMTIVFSVSISIFKLTTLKRYIRKIICQRDLNCGCKDYKSEVKYTLEKEGPSFESVYQ